MNPSLPTCSRSSAPARGPGSARRRGGLYVLVLITVSIATFMALAAAAVRSAEHRAAIDAQDALRARLLAESAIELACQMIENDPSWRTRSADWVTDRPFNGGTLSISVRDPVDSNIGNSAADPIIVRGTGIAGRARQIVEVEMRPTEGPMSCLNVAMAASGNVALNKIIMTTDPISSNATMSADTATIIGTIQARSFSTKGLVVWVPMQLPQDRQFPAADVFDWYVANGSEIPYTSLVKDATKRILENLVLSPAHNPYGSTNPLGIYYIRCDGPIVVRNIRVLGTLVILDVPSSGPSSIEGALVMDPAAPNMPALMIRGPVPFNMRAGTLSESTLGVNLNPPGAPYNGATNATTSDSYPSRIRGITYIRGNVTMSANAPTFQGSLVVDGTLTTSVVPSFTYESPAATPRGFGTISSHRMRIVGGTYRRVTD